MSDSEYTTIIERRTREDGEIVVLEIEYSSDPVPIDKSIDLSLELAEIASPIASLSDTSMAANAFGDVARMVLAKGGHKYVIKLFKICKVRRVTMLIDELGAFSMAYDGIGGLLECTLALQWILEENFGDFFMELLGSIGQNSQVEQEEESKATS